MAADMAVYQTAAGLGGLAEIDGWSPSIERGPGFNNPGSKWTFACESQACRPLNWEKTGASLDHARRTHRLSHDLARGTAHGEPVGSPIDQGPARQCWHAWVPANGRAQLCACTSVHAPVGAPISEPYGLAPWSGRQPDPARAYARACARLARWATPLLTGRHGAVLRPLLTLSVAFLRPDTRRHSRVVTTRSQVQCTASSLSLSHMPSVSAVTCIYACAPHGNAVRAVCAPCLFTCRPHAE